MPVVATVVAVVAASWAGPVGPVIWWVLFVAAVVMSHRILSATVAAITTMEDPRPWENRLLLARLATVLIWSAILVAAWPGPIEPARNFLLLVLSCAMALRMAGSTAVARALLLQMLPPLLALLILCLSTAEPIYGGLAVASLVYAGVLCRIGLRTSRQVRQSLCLQFDLLDAKAAAETANQAKTQFLATLSHEIRTPMTGILGLTRVLLDSDLNERQRDYLRTVQDSGEGLLTLLNDVLDMAKIEAGRLELESTGFDPRALVEGVLRLMLARAEEKGLGLTADIGPAMPARLEGDPLRLRQVLINLVANAIKFTDSGRVTISMRAEPLPDGQVRLGVMVSDTGIGIPQEAQSRLFADFAQADAGIARRYGGSGLGLFICRRLVQAMGGEMGFRSSQDQGSDFWFTVTLPLPDPSENTASALPPLSILVAEDIAANRMVLAALLEGAGHQVTCVDNGAAAVDAVTRRVFDLVLMDLQMDGMDGLQAARAIRALPDPGKATLPIIATSAGDLDDTAERCRAAGMDGCVTKPIRPDRLFAEMAAVWGKAGQVGAVAARSADPRPDPVRDGLRSLRLSLSTQELAELTTLTREALEQALADLQTAWPVRDHAALGRAAHTLGGTAANFGLPALADQARQLKLAVQQEDWTRAEQVLAGLPTTLELAVRQLVDWQTEPASL